MLPPGRRWEHCCSLIYLRCCSDPPQPTGKDDQQQGVHGEKGTNDLTVTTATVAKVGDTVLVKGALSTNKDFGLGYKYDLIIEDAQVTVE